MTSEQLFDHQFTLDPHWRYSFLRAFHQAMEETPAEHSFEGPEFVLWCRSLKWTSDSPKS